MQENKGHVFESETDTEVIAKLVQHIYNTKNKEGVKINFREIVESTIQQLVSVIQLLV